METLMVKLHHLANRSYDVAIQKLCDELNSTETKFPRTNLRMIFKLGSK
ncbi:putative transposase [Bathymodiolus platifrons methanotrophic gill symbiont]